MAEDRDLEILRLPMYEDSFRRISQLACEERLSVRITIHLDRIVLDCEGQDVADRTQDRETLFMKEEGSSKGVASARSSTVIGTYGLGFLSAPL